MTKQEFNEIDISQAWKKLVDKKFSNSFINKKDIMKAINMESNSSIAELKKRIKYKLYWSAGFTISFTIILLFFLNNMDMVLLLGIGITAYLIGFISMYLKYKQIDDEILASGDLLESLKYNAKLIKSVLKIEKTWGMLIFIPAIMMGILGGRVGDGWSLAACFQDPRILLTMLVAIVVMTPILIWSSNKMNKIAFGENLKKLEDNIVKMETLQ